MTHDEGSIDTAVLFMRTLAVMLQRTRAVIATMNKKKVNTQHYCR